MPFLRNAVSPSLRFFPIFLCFLIAFMAFSAPAEASVPGQLSFRWQPNPPEENVVGYRLYYGTQSRLDANSKAKTNFSYDYYIDLPESRKCDLRNGTALCEVLDSTELKCGNLFGSAPTCTLFKLHGTLFFSLTARAATVESSYTNEIMANTNPHVSNNNIVHLVQTLLLKR
jgi:hypothetical protein